jgi:hypothetical protein
MNKDMLKMTNTLPVILESFRHIQKHPSRADNSGAPERTAQHWLTRTLNCLNGQSEFPQAMAASTLLGFTSTICSHSFSYCFITSSVNFYDKAGKYSSNLYMQLTSLLNFLMMKRVKLWGLLIQIKRARARVRRRLLLTRVIR